MTIARDMGPAITELARVRAMAVQGCPGNILADRIAAAILILSECEQRVIALEGGPVPRHWLPQRAPGAGADIIDIAERRRARRGGLGEPVA